MKVLAPMYNLTVWFGFQLWPCMHYGSHFEGQKWSRVIDFFGDVATLLFTYPTLTYDIFTFQLALFIVWTKRTRKMTLSDLLVINVLMRSKGFWRKEPLAFNYTRKSTMLAEPIWRDFVLLPPISVKKWNVCRYSTLFSRFFLWAKCKGKMLLNL